MSEANTTTQERSPVIAIMGHVDHGKSSLLDYIREANVVDSEFGGITQHVSAYEVSHKNAEGVEKKITFIDTPGHAAFSGMRQRGAAIADIAILIVSAEDSVKAQTIEAINIIKENEVPFMVAINKVDKPNANPDKVKADLMEHEVYLEGYGGDVPFAEVSAKTGAGIDELLETILLLAELEEFTGDPNTNARGYIVESHLDPKRGVSATLIIKDGVIKKGQYVVAGCGMAATRILEDFAGNTIDEAQFSSPIRITGFSTQCSAGSEFHTYDSKKEAEEAMASSNTNGHITEVPSNLSLESTHIVPIILKCDVAGMIEATAGEIEKLSGEGIFFKIIKSDVGDINESDIRLAASDDGTIILGFNVKEDNKIKNMNEYEGITINTFNIIYKMSEWLEEIKDERRFRKQVEKTTGVLKILKVFSESKKSHVVGGRVKEGSLSVENKVKIIRREAEIGRGTIKGLQMGKSPVTTVPTEEQCGMELESNINLAEGDLIEAFEVVTQ